MVINVLLLCLCIATKHYEVDAIWMPKNDDLDLEKQLKVINKPPIKTIQVSSSSSSFMLSSFKCFVLLEDHSCNFIY